MYLRKDPSALSAMGEQSPIARGDLGRELGVTTLTPRQPPRRRGSAPLELYKRRPVPHDARRTRGVQGVVVGAVHVQPAHVLLDVDIDHTLLAFARLGSKTKRRRRIWASLNGDESLLISGVPQRGIEDA